jgi:hemerythrin-like metal-binding protein
MMNTKLKPFITWDDSWAVGIDDIDDDHKKLVKLIQKLFGALISAQGAVYVKALFCELIDYTKYHFQREEEIYAENNYDKLNKHKELHQSLIRQVLDMSRNIMEQGETEAVSDELFEFLKGWLINHIINEDLKFKTFLAQR